MPTMHVSQDVRSASLEATIIRADGTREPLGEIAYYHRNPIRRALWHVRYFVRRLLKW